MRSLTPLPWASRVTAPLPGFFSTSAGLSGNRAVVPTSCHARDHGTELGFPMPYFFVVVPLGVLVALAWLVLAKKATYSELKAPAVVSGSAIRPRRAGVRELRKYYLRCWLACTGTLQCTPVATTWPSRPNLPLGYP